jgi:hypothetical protein
MKAQDIRRWLGSYILVLTAFLGSYLLLAGGTSLLPLSPDGVTSSFEIVIPFLLGQVVIVYRFFTGSHAHDSRIPPMEPFFVKAPPLLATAIIVGTLIIMAIGGANDNPPWMPSSAKFKAIITFVVTLLNASTAFVVSRYFEAKGQADKDAPGAKKENP